MRLKRVLSSVLLAVSAAGAPGLSAKMTFALNDTARSGFNGLDHVLQRPLGNPVFEHKRFGDHLFLSGGASVSMMGTNAKPGAALELSLGDWISPVHGWRISGEGGLNSVNKGNPKSYYGAVSADYLLNLTSLLRGYDPARKFELVGAVGAEYRRTRREGVWGNVAGARAALQARFLVAPSLYLYAEPRLSLLAGSYFGGGDDFRRIRPELSFHIGLGYRLLTGAARGTGAADFLNVDDSNLYFGGGVGVATFARGFSRDKIGPMASFHVGKWFSTVSALRLKAQMGRYDLSGTPSRRYVATAALDYVWNISSALGGYRPDEVFGLNLNLGVAAAYGDNAAGKIYPGVEGGLTASFRLSPNWSLFVEPQVQLFTPAFSRDVANRWGGIAPMASIMAGINYTIGDFARRFPRSYEDYYASRRYFLTFSGGAARRFRGDYGDGLAFAVGFGKRFTPVSSWRLTVDGEAFRRSPGYVSLVLGADYICGISTSMAGFNDHRVFDVSGVLGVFGGVANYYDPAKPVFGGKVGLLGAFRLSDALSLNIEPQVLALNARGAGSTGWTPEFRVMLGLNYWLGRGASFAKNALDESPMEGRRNFVSVSAGPGAASSTVLSGSRVVNGSFDAAVGRWFNPVSGLRIGMAYDYIPGSRGADGLNVGTAHLDYLLNVTSLITRDAGRRFHIIGLVGGGCGFSDAETSSAGFMAEAGVQFRYNLPRNIDLHVEPLAGVWMHRVMPGLLAHKRLVALGRVMLGASYRF